MRVFRGIGKFIWRFMVIFSFIVNIVLILVLITLGLLIFEIKNEVAQPLITGLHSSFVGLDDATIDWTIPVRDEIPVILDIPLQQDTVVTLTDSVPLLVNATITRQGVDILGGPVTVNLQLPEGLNLPVALNLNVPVEQDLPVALDVRAVIPLQETQLHDVANNLRLLFEPLARGLHNLPNSFPEAAQMVGDTLSGDPPNLLAENEYSENPWPGYSTTAGLDYELFDEPVPAENQPLQTGIVPIGGIPALDRQLRPQIYEFGGPEAVNEQARERLDSVGVSNVFFNGELGRAIWGEPEDMPTFDAAAQAAAAEGPGGETDEGLILPGDNVGGPLMGVQPTATQDGEVTPVLPTSPPAEDEVPLDDMGILPQGDTP
jgi:hypothetical protein